MKRMPDISIPETPAVPIESRRGLLHRTPRQRRHDPRVTPVHERPGFDFSVTGLVYSCLMMFMGLSAINTQASLLFGVFGLMMGILIVSGMLSRFVVRKVEVRRVLPDQAEVGKPMGVEYLVTNRKRFWPTMSLTIAELDAQPFLRQPHAYVLHVAPGMTARVPVEVVPKRRGFQRFARYQLATSFPFGFIKRAVKRSMPDTLLVYPPLAEVAPELLHRLRSAPGSGQNLKPVTGGEDEFYGIKEFRPGESPRSIYWRRSARTGTLVSKQMTHAAPPTLMILIDTFQVDDSDAAAAAVEKTISQAASLADAAIASGMAVGLVCRGEDWVAIRPARGKRHRRELLSTIAALPINRTWTCRHLLEQPIPSRGHGMTSVLFTPGSESGGVTAPSSARPLVIACNSPEAANWFHMTRNVDFTTVSPNPPAAANRH